MRCIPTSGHSVRKMKHRVGYTSLKWHDSIVKAEVACCRRPGYGALNTLVLAGAKVFRIYGESVGDRKGAKVGMFAWEIVTQRPAVKSESKSVLRSRSSQ